MKALLSLLETSTLLVFGWLIYRAGDLAEFMMGQ